MMDITASIKLANGLVEAYIFEDHTYMKIMQNHKYDPIDITPELSVELGEKIQAALNSSKDLKEVFIDGELIMWNEKKTVSIFAGVCRNPLENRVTLSAQDAEKLANFLIKEGKACIERDETSQWDT